MKQALFIIIITCGFSTLFSLEMKDKDMMLLPPEPEKPTIMGVPFGINSKSATKLITSKGLKFKQQISCHDGYVKVMIFEGIPANLAVDSGTSQFVFFKDQLVKMDYFFNPSYSNFLVIRRRLFDTLEDRFSISEKKEEMDKFLRAHLAGLERGGLNQKSEELIKDSITRGKTFFFYTIKDSQDQLNSSLSLTANRQDNRAPQLLLHYSLKSGIKEFESHLNTMSQGAKLSTP